MNLNLTTKQVIRLAEDSKVAARDYHSNQYVYRQKSNRGLHNFAKRNRRNN